MSLTILQYHWEKVVRSILVAMGGIFLLIESYEVVSNDDLSLPYHFFLILTIVAGLVWFWIDGHFVAGFLKREVTILSNGFDTKVVVKFGDLFAEQGWKAIAVNDFFDSQVDEKVISSKSLHGHVINSFWSDGSDEWQEQINNFLGNINSTEVTREQGNKHRYPIGTAVDIQKDDNKFLFVALGTTNEKTHETAATATDLIKAVRGLLSRARSVVGGEPLNLPLMGSGLGRVGIKNAILIDLILVAIFEETKQLKITDTITIILPDEKESGINLGAISRDWN